MKTNMKQIRTVILLSIPFSLLSIVMATFVWMGSEAGTDSIHYIGYVGVVIAASVTCKVSYQKGRIDERLENQHTERWTTST